MLIMLAASSWIAIVDDDPSVLKALTRLLRARALHARTFQSAQTFLAALPEGLPDCLILDLQMPEMSGLELIGHLTRRSIHIPTIIVTAHDDTWARRQCESAGVVAFLTKPLQDTSLFAAVAKAGGEPGKAGEAGN
jgi:FixJ family two-component response regulator